MDQELRRHRLRRKLKATLDRLATYLAEPRTAREIMDELKCSKPTAYARVKALEDCGVVVRYGSVRDGAHGPRAVTFQADPKSLST